MSVFDLANESYRDRDDKMCVPLLWRKETTHKLCSNFHFVFFSTDLQRLNLQKPLCYSAKNLLLLLDCRCDCTRV